MKKNKGILTAAIVAGVGLLIYFGTKILPAARVKYYGKGIELKGGKLSYKVELINPGSKAVSLEMILIDFYYNQTYLGKVYFNQPVNIPAKQLVNISLPVSASVIGLATLAADFALKKPISITASGTIKTQGFNVPVKETLKLS